MKIIREPSVFLVGRQTIANDEVERFLGEHDISQWETDTSIAGEKLVELAGRMCYMSYAKPRPGGNAAYIERLLEVGHGSVLEHACWNFIVTGVSRSFTHELVRHRAGFGYSQLSQRYVDESTAEFVEPECIAEDAELHAVWSDAVQASQAAYIKLVEGLQARFASVSDATMRRKMARQAARSVLPNATETKIFITGNGRAFRHFIEMRANEHAETEIRAVACRVCEILQVESPNMFGDYKFITLDDGTRAVATEHTKV